jgi:hypothetical protein
MSKASISILFEMERLTKSLIKMEYKSRRLFEEHEGNPPPGTVVLYNRIMEVDAKNMEYLREKLGIWTDDMDEEEEIRGLRLKIARYERKFADIDHQLFRCGDRAYKFLQEEKRYYGKMIEEKREELQRLLIG